jgi:hypothetical protein
MQLKYDLYMAMNIIMWVSVMYNPASLIPHEHPFMGVEECLETDWLVAVCLWGRLWTACYIDMN